MAFRYEQDTIYAPCDGEIIVVAETRHAIGLKSVTGVELLLHVGVDTVSLNGSGFETLVKPGQHVKAGKPLLIIDKAWMKEQHIDLITSLVITNSKDIEVDILAINQNVIQGTTEIIRKKGEKS